MNHSILRLVVIPEVENFQSKITSFDTKVHGSHVSTKNEIKVNKVTDGYSIIYHDTDILEMDSAILLKNIMDLMSKNLPDCEFDFTIHYYYVAKNDVDKSVVKLNMDVARKLISIDSALVDDEDGVIAPLKYQRSTSIIGIASVVSKLTAKAGNIVVEEGPALDVAYQVKPEVVKQNPMQTDDMRNMNTSELMRSLYGFNLEDDDDDDYHDKKKKKKVKKVTYGSSRIIKASSDPKKYYKRHGVIVCNEKRAIKRDATIIKDFLEDFIPGSGWQKDLRKDLCKRWLSTFVVTKSQLKKLEKDYVKEKRSKSMVESGKRVIDFTSKVLYTPVDSWNDPTR
jgi:hypothetical protein